MIFIEMFISDKKKKIKRIIHKEIFLTEYDETNPVKFANSRT